MTNTRNRPSYFIETIVAALNHGNAAADALEPLAAIASWGIARRDISVQIELAVTAARAQGETWQAIGDHLGVSKQAAQQMYG